MINNLHLIRPLLQFPNVYDFYRIKILKRKKDHPDTDCKSVEMIKTYNIENWDYLTKKWNQITKLCEEFGARAYIHPQKHNHQKISMEVMCELPQRIKYGSFDQSKLFDKVADKIDPVEKRWVIDIDNKEVFYLDYITKRVEDCEPNGVPKVLQTIPTKSGFHLITIPFHRTQFVEMGFEEYIHTNGPTLLYLPNSLS